FPPMFEEYGFTAPKSQLVHSAEEAAAFARQLGSPVALKIESPQILHKTNVGGVALNLAGEPEIRAAYDRMLASVRAASPDAALSGVQVQEMVARGVEIIIGLLDDPQFGPVILFGLGGVLTEILQDVSFRVLPIDRADALQMVRETRGTRILQGYRGEEPVSEEALADLLLRAGKLGMDQAGSYESIDFNPVVVWGDQHRVLDVKLVRRDVPRPLPAAARPNPSGLKNFFKPASVALVGASATPGKVGNAVLDSLARSEYRGRVYPINPKAGEILGIPTYPSLSAVPDPVDLVVVTVDLGLVPGILEECASRGTHNMVIISGGGKEIGGEKADLEARIRRMSREAGVRIIGPNCTGVFDGETRLATFFQTQERLSRPGKGRVALMTQSGTVGLGFLEDAAPFGVSNYVSYGNRVDVDEADLLAYWGSDPEVDVIAIYVEGLEDGRKFLQAAREVTRSKPVVIYKSARSARAARASLSHTGFFGGSYAVADGAFRQAGLVRANSYDELAACTKALAMQPRARGRRVAMISNGAGSMVQAMDDFQAARLSMPDLSPETVSRLTQVYPAFYVVQNPVDVTGSASSGDYEVGIEALLQDPNVDIVMPWFVFVNTPLGVDIVQKLGRLSRQYAKPILVGAFGSGAFTRKMFAEIEAVGVPTFDSVGAWTAAARGLADAGEAAGFSGDVG
ncbi:MAG TPA: acetate--CoA ligase family protein, partial [Anaerolineaceae bacterium]